MSVINLTATMVQQICFKISLIGQVHLLNLSKWIKVAGLFGIFVVVQQKKPQRFIVPKFKQDFYIYFILKCIFLWAVLFITFFKHLLPCYTSEFTKYIFSNFVLYKINRNTLDIIPLTFPILLPSTIRAFILEK